MPPMTITELHSKVHKLKNQISKAANYLELEKTIDDLNKLKLKLNSKHLKLNQKEHSTHDIIKHQDHQQALFNQQKDGLFQVCQQIIKEKMKYFKKIVINRMETSLSPPAEQQRNPKQSKKKPSGQTTKNKNSTLSSPASSSCSNFNPSKKAMRQKQTPFLLQRELQKSPSVAEKQQSSLRNRKKQHKQFSRQNPSIQRTQKRLKQSKSVDHLLENKLMQGNGFTFRDEDQQNEGSHNQISWNKKSRKGCMSGKEQEHNFNDKYEEYEMDDDDKTQIKGFKKNKGDHYNSYSKIVDSSYGNKGDNTRQNDEELDHYKSKLQCLEQILRSCRCHASNNLQYQKSPKNYTSTSSAINLPPTPNLCQPSIIFQQFHYKLRQKSLQLEQLKGRLSYYESKSQQMKNRLLNEQRRNEDYIQGLIKNIKTLQETSYQSSKENKLMAQVIRQYEIKNQQEQKEKYRLMERIQQVLKQKQSEMAKLNQKQNNNKQDLKQELQLMAQQELFITQLKQSLSKEQIEHSILLQKHERLLQYNILAKQNQSECGNTIETLQQLLTLKLEEIQNYKVELHKLKRDIAEKEEELEKMANEVQECRNQQQEDEKKKQKNIKKKVDQLKEVRTLLIGAARADG